MTYLTINDREKTFLKNGYMMLGHQPNYVSKSIIEP